MILLVGSLVELVAAATSGSASTSFILLEIFEYIFLSDILFATSTRRCSFLDFFRYSFELFLHRHAGICQSFVFLGLDLSLLASDGLLIL